MTSTPHRPAARRRGLAWICAVLLAVVAWTPVAWAQSEDRILC